MSTLITAPHLGNIELPRVPHPKHPARPYYSLPPMPSRDWWLEYAPERLRELHEHRAVLRARGDRLEGADKWDYLRLRGKADFEFFIKRFFWADTSPALRRQLWEPRLHTPMAWAWTAPDGTRYVDTFGVPHTLDRFRLGTITRGHLKSTIFTAGYAAWCVVRDPEERILIYAATDDLAESFLQPVKELMEGKGPGGRLFCHVFADIIPDDKERTDKKWNKRDIIVKRQGRYTDTTIKARGVESKIVGGHFTRQLIDDLQVQKLPAMQVDKIIGSLLGLTPMYHNPRQGRRRMVGTPWGFRNPMFFAAEKWPRSSVFCVPWRDAHKKPVFPWSTGGKAAHDEIMLVKAQDPEFYYTQYEVIPKVDNATGFQRSWFRYFRLERGKIHHIDKEGKRTGHVVALSDCHVFMFIDPNTGREADEVTRSGGLPTQARDYAGWTVVAMDKDMNRYVLWARRWRCNPRELADETHKLVGIWQPKFVAIEQTAAQRVFVWLFREDWKRGRPIFVLRDFEGSKGTKLERIRGLIPLYSNGFVFHRESVLEEGGPAAETTVAKGIVHLEDELLDFPNAEFDDLSDSLSAMLPMAYAPGKSAPSQTANFAAQAAWETTLRKLDAASAREAAYIRQLMRGGRFDATRMLLGDRIDDGIADAYSGLVSTRDMEDLL